MVQYDQNVKTILDFLVGNGLEETSSAQAIFLFGQPGAPKAAEHAALLYKQGRANLVIVSGGVSSSGMLAPGGTSEARYFQKILESEGVPSSAIVLEERASNTQENVVFGIETARLLGIVPESLLLVSIPPHLLRCRLTVQQNASHIETVVCSTFGFNPEVWCSQNDGVRRILGELERINAYSLSGYISSIDIPKEVRKAYRDALATHGLSGERLTWKGEHLEFS